MKILKPLVRFAGLATVALSYVPVALAEEAATGGATKTALGSGIAIGLAALGGTLGQGKAVSAMLESYGRNPSVGGKLFAPMVLGLVLIESLVILAFVIAYLSL